jgi:hypothetical protein
MHNVSDIIYLSDNYLRIIPVINFNKYLQFFMTTYDNVKICPVTGYVFTLHRVNCYTSLLQQCKCSFGFIIFILIIINLSNVITVAIFVVILYAEINFSWMKKGPFIRP